MEPAEMLPSGGEDAYLTVKSDPKPSLFQILWTSVVSDAESYLNEYVHYCGCSVSAVEDSSLTYIFKLINLHDVVVFAKNGCGFCAKAEAQLTELGLERQFTRVIIDVNSSTPEGRNLGKGLMSALVLPNLTFPQIVVKGEYIGGADDLSEHVAENRFFHMLDAEARTYTLDGERKVTWNPVTWERANTVKMFYVPPTRVDGQWYPLWPWYTFHWTMWSNLVRYISWIQLAIMIPALSLYKLGSRTQVLVANVLIIILLVDLVGLVLFGPSPWSISGSIATYFGWRFRGSAVSSLPYKLIFTIYLSTLMPLYVLGKQEDLLVSLSGFIVNSTLLAVFRF